MTWTEQPIFFLDFEGSRASGVLEFGMVEVWQGRIVDAQTSLCRATGRVREEDIAVHGLSERAVASSAPFADHWERFASRREQGPFAAHYAGVENSLLKATWPYPRSSPHFGRPGERVIEWGPWIDTARLYAELYPALGSGRLQSLVAGCGLQLELDQAATQWCPADRRDYHAALYDALAGALLLTSLARDPHLAALTVMQLLALSTLAPGKRDELQQGELFGRE